jgi:hypothetical protein
VLLREYQGERHTVTVVAKGYVFGPAVVRRAAVWRSVLGRPSQVPSIKRTFGGSRAAAAIVAPAIHSFGELDSMAAGYAIKLAVHGIND